ncbi:hypothetical protein AB0I10_37315 [Streptomyces sp. NPDC050636]|uniref:hypothetical protein n=1 Tax=Streptomyces sp. NPDC050636 TaxID=3154510 RepID=UPI003440D3EA
MPRHQPNHRLAALLTEANWNAGELACAINDLGRAQGLSLHYDRTAVAHWLTGSRPRSPVPDLAAQALSHRTGRLITTEETGLAPPRHDGPTPTAIAIEADPVTALVTLARSDTDPTHRTALTHSIYSLTNPAIPAWSEEGCPASPPARSGRRRATSADAQRLDGMIRIFARLAACHGGAHARSALAAYLADDVSPLLTRRAPRALQLDLLTYAAQLTHLLATMTTDAGHHRLAQHYYTAALGLSRQADNRTTYAITLRAMSTQALQLGHLTHAARLAEAATDAAGRNVPSAVKAFVLIQHALTDAHNRQPRKALTRLAAAETHHEKASGPPGPFTSYPRADLDYQRAATLLVLGHHTNALEALTSSADRRVPSQHRPVALTHARLAGTYLQVGHLEAACAHWRHFLQHYPHLQSHTADQALTQLQAHLRPHSRHPAARSLLQSAHTLTDR